MDEQKNYHKVEITLTEEAYQALLYMRAEEHDTGEGVINAAVMEYAKNHYPPQNSLKGYIRRKQNVTS